MSAMSPYLSDCMPEDRVATQPPSVLWVKAVREVTESPAVLAQLPLDVWTQRSSLDRRQPGVVIDLEHTIEPAQINRDHRPGLIRRRFEAAGDVAATAERDQHGVGSDHPINDQLHLRLVARIDDHVRDPRDVAGAQPHQISQALAIGLHDPIKVIRVDVVEADGVGQLSQELVADPRGGIGRSSRFSGGVGGVFRSRSTACCTKGRNFGLSSWWKPTPSTPQPHHFMCGTVAISFSPW